MGDVYIPYNRQVIHYHSLGQIIEGTLLFIIGLVLVWQYFGIDLGFQDFINSISSSTTITISIGVLSITSAISHLGFGVLLLAMGVVKISTSGRTEYRRYQPRVTRYY